MGDILKSITDDLPKVIKDAGFEGANIVLYTDNAAFFKESESQIKELVNKYKKRIELRADESILETQEKTEETIRQIIPEEAELTNIIFDQPRSIVIIEAKKPGMVIGKQGSVLQEIKDKTFWSPQVQRSASIKSKITDNIREVLYANNSYRRKFLNDVGKKIYKDWSADKKEGWIRLTMLGSGRQVGRSCILLQTPISKILLDCGIDVASHGADRFPYFDIPEFDISTIDAVILSHAHLDHCLPPHFRVLTEEGYKKIDEIQVGEKILSMNWKTGKYEIDKCTEKTRTTGHKKILTIKTPYSKIESSPNHRFFTFEDLKLKELEASQLKKGMLLPSNLFNKPELKEKIIDLNININYDKRRKDNIILPNKLTTQLAEFLGYYMGDGHKSSEFSLRLTDMDLQILNYHKNLVKEIFNFESKIRHHSDKSKNASILELNNVKIIRFLEQNFPEAFNKAKDIFIPEKIINSSSDIQKAFLRGFADAEGSFADTIKITSYSKQMLEDLQYLLSLQKIPSIISPKSNSVYLNSKFSIIKFHQKVSFSHEGKQKKLSSKIKTFSNTNFDKEDLMPLTSKDLRKILENAGLLGRINKSPNLSQLLPLCLLDLFRRKEGYATRKTAEILLNFLIQRINELKSIKSESEIYALRRLLSITRVDVSSATGLKVHQIQKIEENKQLSQEYIHVLSSFIKERLSSVILQTEQNMQTLQNLLSLNVLWEKISNIDEKDNSYEYLVDIEVENNHNFIAHNIIVHNCGLLPYLYKMGYKGPVYMTTPTRDITALLALDFIGVAYKQAATPLFSSQDIKEMVKHSICLNFNEVTDVTPDIRITFYNSGHALGSAMVHINIGNGSHNLLYGADMKYIKTRLLDPAVTNFPRVESLIMESTYGGKADILPPRAESENTLLEYIKKTIEREGKVLIPELGLGRAQETMLIIDDAIRSGKLPSIPVYVDGMIWDINAIHTAYPDFLSNSVRNLIFQDKNPFVSETFKQVGSAQERKQVIEGGHCVVLATSGMLVGGASVEYLKHFAGNKRNSIVFVCYQGVGSLGRQIQEGLKEWNTESGETIPIELEVHKIDGFSAHAGRTELLNFVKNCKPKPKRVIINHGEVSKSLDLASSLYKIERVETNVPRNLETIRLK
ncbi:MAG: MBL fold metallo-hydrolase RNA specificity domain-containing protein [Nanoarchaeota archaeon]